MNGLERYHLALQGKLHDFSPRTPLLMQFAAHYIGRSYGDFTSDYRVLTEANLRCAEDFGCDQVSAISDPYREAAGFGSSVQFFPDMGAVVHTPLLAKGIDLSLLKRPDPLLSERMHDRLKALEVYQKTVGGRLSILGWVEGAAAEAADLRGLQDFLTDLVEEPESVMSLLEVCVDNAIHFAQAQVDRGADIIGIGDAVASQISPALYEEYILPYQKKLVMAIRNMGCCVRMHICGNITHLLPGLAQLDIQAIDVDHMVDLKNVRKALPKVLIGANLDPVTQVMRGSSESIRRDLLECRKILGLRFAVNAGCEIPSRTPHEAFKSFCAPLLLDGE